MFIGRNQELQFLEDKYNSQAGQLVVLYGRRRIGKTETLREFCKGKQHVFYSCREVSDKLQLRSFSEKLLREHIPAADYIREFSDWETAFKGILDLPYGNEKNCLSSMSSRICAGVTRAFHPSCRISGTNCSRIKM